MGFWRVIALWALMPELAVQEHCKVLVRNYYIWTARNLGMHLMSYASPVESLMHQFLPLCTLASYPGHCLAPLFRIHIVRRCGSPFEHILSMESNIFQLRRVSGWYAQFLSRDRHCRGICSTITIQILRD